MRAKKPIGIIDAYYDGGGQALCPAATGISHHISPWGDIEPCPIVQFAKESIHDDRARCTTSSCNRNSCATSAQMAAEATRGCIVLERPDLVQRAGRETRCPRHDRPQHGAWPSWKPCSRASQYQPGHESPRRAGSTASPRSTGSTISAPTAATITVKRPLPGLLQTHDPPLFTKAVSHTGRVRLLPQPRNGHNADDLFRRLARPAALRVSRELHQDFRAPLVRSRGRFRRPAESVQRVAVCDDLRDVDGGLSPIHASPAENRGGNRGPRSCAG